MRMEVPELKELRKINCEILNIKGVEFALGSCALIRHFF